MSMKRAIIQTLLRAARPDLANVVAYHVTAAKELYYHGTSTVFAKRILSEGFVPDPKRKIWNPERGGLASYHGTYLSKDFPTASSAASNAAIKFGGRQCVFECQIETRSALMDEDELPNMARTIDRAAGYYLLDNLSSNANDKYRAEYYRERNAEMLADPKTKELVEKAVGYWLEDFEGRLRESAKPLAPKYVAHLKGPIEQWVWAMLYAAADGKRVAQNEETQEIRVAKIALMKAIGSAAKLDNSQFLGKNARIVEPITFRGANRILAAIVEPQYWDPIVENRDRNAPYPVYVVYGKPSAKMLSGMKNISDKIQLVKMPLSKIPNVFGPWHKPQKMAARTVARPGTRP